MAPSARTARARVELARRLGTQGVIESDPMTGTLRMVGRLDGYLTGRSARPARTVAIGFVRSNLAAFGLTKADLKTFRLRQDYVDIAGVHHISWTQARHGVPVFHNGLRANVTSDGRLLNITGSPVHAIRVGIGRYRHQRPTRRSVRHASTGVRRSPPRRAPTRRRSCCSRRDAAPDSHGRPSPGRTRNSSTCRWWTPGAGRSCIGRASRATTPEPRRRGSSTRATWSPPVRTWRTPSRSRWSTARASTATTRTCGRM